jgi:heme-degrading monooxygenase HmoA
LSARANCSRGRIAGGRVCLTAEKADKEKIMYVRMNMLAGDPARLDEAARYLEGSVRPHVEGQPGNRGIAFMAKADLGVCVVASYWDSLDAMTASEQEVQVSRKEMTELTRGTVTVEHYEVPVFVRRSRPQAGATARLTRIECNPASLDAAIDEFRNTAVPALMDMPGMCSTQWMADRATGRCIVVTAWEDMEALAAGRSRVATLRADQAAVSHLQVRSVEEYNLVFSSVREGDTRSLIERDIELWNARDRAGWLAGADLHRMELQAPGGLRLAGRDAAEAIWTTWNEAFPDNRLEIIAIHADDRGGVHEGRFLGTHTEPSAAQLVRSPPPAGPWTRASAASTSSTRARSSASTCTSTRPNCSPNSAWHRRARAAAQHDPLTHGREVAQPVPGVPLPAVAVRQRGQHA